MPGYAMTQSISADTAMLNAVNQPTEQRNVRAGRAHSEKLESAYHRRGENAERYRRAELQKRTHKTACGWV